MPELERLREQIAYFKYVQGIMVLSLVILGLHRQIGRCIERIGKFVMGELIAAIAMIIVIGTMVAVAIDAIRRP
jgi:hypothetical protein